MGYFERVPPDPENLIGTTTRISDGWYNEVEDYDFDNPGVVPPGK